MLVLASQSPRRREILAQAGFSFTVRVPGVEEVRLSTESPEDYVRRLALEKARAAASSPEEFVLAADTVVVVEGAVLEKPISQHEAGEMLRRLSGRSHAVLTGVCLLHGGQEWSEVESTRVVFSPLTEDEVRDYCASGEPMDKAGAYALQGKGAIFVEGIVGSHTNVVGLPLMETVLLLRSFGVKI